MSKTLNTTIIISSLWLMISCSGQRSEWDASGVFETTEIIVSSEVNGKIEQFNLLEGDILQAEGILGYIDTTQLYLQKMQLIANNRATLSQRISVPKQIASIKQEIVTQQKEKKRFEALVQANAANQKTVDDIDAVIKSLEKQLDAQVERLEQGNRGVDDQSLSIELQIAQLDDLLQKSIIRNPISGIVLTKYAEAGELITQGRPLFKISNIEEMYLRAYITADQLTRCKIGDQITIFSDLGKDESRQYEGKITWISDQAEFTPKTIQTRNERANLVYAIKVLVKNDGYIKRGMYGEIKFKE